MIEILNRFLIQNRSISIPGLGTLRLKRLPARLNEDESSILPPAHNISFDKYFDAPDKDFFTYLATHQQVPDYEAMREYNQFAQDFRSEIMTKNSAEWQGIGRFSRNQSGEIEFLQIENSINYFRPVSLFQPPAADPVIEDPVSPVVSEDEIVAAVDSEAYESQLDTRPEKWRMVTGWVLLAVTVGSLLVYFGGKGFHLNTAGNQQKLQVVRPQR